MGLQGHVRNPRRPLVSTPVSSWVNFSPLALKPLFWFDASDTTSITSSAGRVSQWDDLSGNVRAATQATGSLQPTTGSATQNGLNVLSFGVNRLDTPSFSFSGSTFTCFTVVKASTSAMNNRQILGLRGSNPTMWLNNGQWALYTSAVFSSTTTYDTNWHLFVGVFNAAGSSIRLDGAQIATGNPGVAAYGSGAYIGAANPASGQPFLGDIAEIFVSPLLLSGNDIRTVENHLNAKWAIY